MKDPGISTLNEEWEERLRRFFGVQGRMIDDQFTGTVTGPPNFHGVEPQPEVISMNGAALELLTQLMGIAYDAIRAKRLDRLAERYRQDSFTMADLPHGHVYAELLLSREI